MTGHTGGEAVPHHRRALLALLVLLAALAPLAIVLVAGGDRAAAQEAQEDGDEAVRGTLIDRKGTRERDDDEPIEDAEITIETIDGEEVGVAVTDDEGRYELELPGPGSFVAILDLDTLPEGVSLAEGAERLEFVIQPNQSRPLLFELGARERETTSKLEQIPQLAFEGLKLGLLIAIAAVGLSLAFGTTGLVNFAHGELVTWGAIVAWFINVRFDVPLLAAAGLAMVICGVTAGVFDVGLWRQLRSRKVSLLAMMIVSIGLGLAARNIFQMIFGETTEPYNDFVIQRGFDFGPITAAPKDLWTIGIAVAALVAVALLLQYTRMGKATRAVADNPDLASSSGIDVDRVILYVWIGSGVLAALGGILFAVSERVQFDMGFRMLLLMFAGITLGGLGTAYGALVGSIVVGLAIQLSTLVISTELKNVVALFVLALVLLFMPQGILGRRERIG